MASKNRLIGSGVDYEKLYNEEMAKQAETKRTPAWRYHKTCPEGIVVKTDDELDKFDAEGWVDHPAKVRDLPGHPSMLAVVEEEEEEVLSDDDSDN